jgi:hypothetical protein
LIASDHVDVDVAASAVERRWADAVGFLQPNEEPDFIRRLVDHARDGKKLGIERGALRVRRKTSSHDGHRALLKDQ